jgi:hypothetical protein
MTELHVDLLIYSDNTGVILLFTILAVPTQLQSDEAQTKVTVVEGSNSTIKCPVRASQKDVIKWYKVRCLSLGIFIRFDRR